MEATERLGWATGQVEASGQKSAFRRASDPAGRNASPQNAIVFVGAWRYTDTGIMSFEGSGRLERERFKTVE